MCWKFFDCKITHFFCFLAHVLFIYFYLFFLNIYDFVRAFTPKTQRAQRSGFCFQPCSSVHAVQMVWRVIGAANYSASDAVRTRESVSGVICR